MLTRRPYWPSFTTKADDLEIDQDLLAEREVWGNKMEMRSLAKECSALVDQLRAAKADNAERLVSDQVIQFVEL